MTCIDLIVIDDLLLKLASHFDWPKMCVNVADVVVIGSEFGLPAILDAENWKTGLIWNDAFFTDFFMMWDYFTSI